MNFGRALGRQAQRLVGDQLVGGEAVVQFDHVHVVGADAGGLVDLGRGLGRHVVAHHARACRGCRRCWAVGGHGLGGDAHAAVQPVPRGESRRADDGRGGAAGGRAALQRVSGSNTVGEAITSSSVTVWRNTASGLRAACWRALTEMRPKVSMGCRTAAM
jgi:hypothetical protein